MNAAAACVITLDLLSFHLFANNYCALVTRISITFYKKGYSGPTSNELSCNDISLILATR